MKTTCGLIIGAIILGGCAAFPKPTHVWRLNGESRNWHSPVTKDRSLIFEVGRFNASQQSNGSTVSSVFAPYTCAWTQSVATAKYSEQQLEEIKIQQPKKSNIEWLLNDTESGKEQQKLMDRSPVFAWVISPLWLPVVVAQSAWLAVFEPFVWIENAIWAGESSTGKTQWGRPKEEIVSGWVHEVDPAPMQVEIDLPWVKAVVTDNLIEIRLMDSNWNFDAKTCAEQGRVASIERCALILMDPTDVSLTFLEDPERPLVDSFHCTVKISPTESPSTTQTRRVPMFRPAPPPDEVAVIRQALADRLAALLYKFEHLEIGGLARLPEAEVVREEAEAMIRSVVNPDYADRARSIFGPEIEEFIAGQEGRIIERIRPDLDAAFVEHRFRIMDVASRTPIIGAHIAIQIKTSKVEELIAANFAPQSRETVRETLSPLLERLQARQIFRSESGGYFRIVAPEDAKVDMEVTADDYHFLRHEFSGLRLSPRTEESSLFLPNDAIGLFTSRKELPLRQEIVQ